MINSAVVEVLAQRTFRRARLPDGACPAGGGAAEVGSVAANVVLPGSAANARLPLLSAEIIDSDVGFQALQSEWNQLFAESAGGSQVFASFAVCWNWHRAFNIEISKSRQSFGLRILAVRDHGRLVVVCPLAEDKWLGLRRLSWFGAPVSQYGDMLVAGGARKEAYVRYAVEFLRKRSGADVLKLWKVREDSVTRGCVAELDGSMICSDTALSADLAKSESWSAFEGGFSSKVRKNRRRQRRRLEERGQVRFDALGPGTQAAQACAEALELKHLWLKARGRVSRGLANPGTERFFRSVALDGNDEAGLRVFRLSCGGKTAALAIGFVAKDRLVIHILVYNLDMASTGAGALLLEDVMKWCFDQRLAVCDLMAPGDDYKLEWCRDRTDVSDWVVPLTPRGRLLRRLGLFHASRVVKSAVAWLPHRLRRTLAHAYGLMVPFID